MLIMQTWDSVIIIIDMIYLLFDMIVLLICMLACLQEKQFPYWYFKVAFVEVVPPHSYTVLTNKFFSVKI